MPRNSWFQRLLSLPEHKILAIYSGSRVVDDACSKDKSMPHLRRTFMRRDVAVVTATAVFTLFGRASVLAQQTPASSAAVSVEAKQTETDEYTRYELLAP